MLFKDLSEDILNGIFGEYLSLKEIIKINIPIFSKYFDVFSSTILIVKSEIIFNECISMTNIKFEDLIVNYLQTLTFLKYIESKGNQIRFLNITFLGYNESTKKIISTKIINNCQNLISLKINQQIPRNSFESLILKINNCEITEFYFNHYMHRFIYEKDLKSIIFLHLKYGYDLKKDFIGFNLCEYSTLNKNIESLQYFHLNGCPFKNSLRYIEIRNECKKYIIKNSVPKFLNYKCLKPVRFIYIQISKIKMYFYRESD